MALLSRAAILAAPVPFKDIEVSELGGTIRLQALTAVTRMTLLDVVIENERAVEDYAADQERDEGEREGVEPAKRLDATFLRMIWMIVGEDGKPLFTLDDIDHLAGLSYPTIRHIAEAMTSLDTRADFKTLKKTSK